MSGILVDEGKDRILNQLFVATAVDATLYLGIYLDTVQPDPADGLAEITEVTGDGYSRIALTRGTWTVLDKVATYPKQTFTATGTWGDCYGYFICNVASGTGGILIGVEHFSDGPYLVGNGDEVDITCKINALA